jgi:magnesium-transporting ATPase (P-type)
MVGDGANDVLALKEANLGIAMGSGSAAARAVADVVLLQDSFAALPSVLSAGRQIVNGMRQAIRLFLVRDVATLELIVASSFVGAPFPLLPPHSAILAFLTVGLPAFLVVSWAKPDRRPVSLREYAGFVLWVGSAYSLAVFTIYAVALAGVGLDVVQARTAVVTTAMLCGLFTVLLSGHSLDAPVREYLDDPRTLALVGGSLAAYLGVLYLPGLHAYFELAALDPHEWLYCVPPVVLWFGALRLQAKHHIAERLLDIGDGSEVTGPSGGPAQGAEALSPS